MTHFWSKKGSKNDPFLDPLLWKETREKLGKWTKNGSKKGSKKGVKKWSKSGPNGGLGPPWDPFLDPPEIGLFKFRAEFPLEETKTPKKGSKRGQK